MLNEEQKRAVEEFATDLLVMAGAGTGKTRVLTQKYLYLLKSRKCEVPQIVAVTFTNKAADEMRARIRQELESAYRKSQGREAAYWWRQLGLLEVSAMITTIHGLCFTLLRQHPVEAGIDPRVTILDEGEEYLFKAKAAQRALSAFLAEDETGANLPVVLALGAKFFLEQLPALYSVLREAGAEMERLEAGEALLAEGPKPEMLKALLAKTLFRLRQEAVAVKLTPRARELLDTLFTRWPAWQEELEKMESLTEDGLAILADLLACLPKNLNKQLRPVLDEIHTLADQLQTALVSREAGRQKPVLLSFLRSFDREYSRLKQREGKLDFTDQQYLVRKLLREHPAVAEEYRRRFAYFMVDEFQDTNSLQWEIIRLLRGDGGREGRLFLVGDLKQSIYRFRGAEVEIMTNLAASRLEAKGQVLVLAKNYRTKPAVAEVINSICGFVFAAEAFPYQPIIPATTEKTGGQKEGDDEGESGVEILLAPEDEPGMLAVRLRQLVEKGELQIRSGNSLRAVRYGDVAVLFRTTTHLKAFEDAFRTAGIPYQVTAGVGFYARQEIQDQLNFLRLVECPEDGVALAGVLRSPFCQVSDTALFWLAQPHGLTDGFYRGKQASDYPMGISEAERRRLARLRHLLVSLSQNAHLLSIPDLLRWAWRETGYLETVAAFPEGRRALGNLEKLIQRAEEFAAHGYAGVGEFVAFLQHLSALEVREGEAPVAPEGDFVQMMTIHAAKGLEFPVVVLPELDSEFNLAARTTVFYDPKAGVIHKVKAPNGRWLETTETQKFGEREKRAEISELKRLFYVGMTRARDYLILSGTEKEVRAAAVEEGRSWLDWLFLKLPELATAKEGRLLLDGRPIKLTRSVPPLAKPVPLGAEREPVAAEIAAAREGPLPAGKFTTKRLSLTPLLTFQECPRRFFWQHRLGSDPAVLPAEAQPPTAAGLSVSYSLLLGDVFHRLIAAAPDGRTERTPDFAYFFPELPPAEQEEAAAQLRAMYQNYLASPFVPQPGVRVENELPFVLDLKGVIIKGIIDRVLFYPDGRMVVVDFKTNRRLPPPGKIRNRYYFQVYLYALALRAIYGQLPAEAWIYFVRPNRQLPCPLTAENLAATEEEIMRSVEYITTHDHPEDYPPGADCEFCPFTPWCRATVSSSQ